MANVKPSFKNDNSIDLLVICDILKDMPHLKLSFILNLNLKDKLSQIKDYFFKKPRINKLRNQWNMSNRFFNTMSILKSNVFFYEMELHNSVLNIFYNKLEI